MKLNKRITHITKDGIAVRPRDPEAAAMAITAILQSPKDIKSEEIKKVQQEYYKQVGKSCQ